MKRILILAMASVMLAALSTPSMAETYVSAYAGAVVPHDSDVTVNTGANLGQTGEMTFRSGYTGGLKLGGWLDGTPYLGAQLDANWHITDTKTLVNSTGTVSNTTANVTMYSLAANVLLRRPEGKIRPYIGGGVGWYWADFGILAMSPNVFAIPGKADKAGGFGYQALAGIDNRINDNLSWFAEYRFSSTSIDFATTLGLDIDYMASQYTLGVTYTF